MITNDVDGDDDTIVCEQEKNEHADTFRGNCNDDMERKNSMAVSSAACFCGGLRHHSLSSRHQPLRTRALQTGATVFPVNRNLQSSVETCQRYRSS